MGGEVNVYEVAAYRPQYINDHKEIVSQKLYEGMNNWRIADYLRENYPASIKVGKGFYNNVVRNIVDSDENLFLKNKEIRINIRRQTISQAIWGKNAKESSKKISKRRLDWWNKHPEKRTEYAENILTRKGMGYSSLSQITIMGYRVRSKLEKIAHEWLYKQGIPFQYEVHIGDGRFVDLIIGSVYVEIDGMSRNREYWELRFGLLPYEIITVSSQGKERYAILIERLREICKNQGYKV